VKNAAERQIPPPRNAVAPPDGATGWLLSWQGAQTITQAAARLVAHGHVVILADVQAQDLPPPLAAEIAASERSAHPLGYRVRRGIARALAARVLGGQAADYPVQQDGNGAPHILGAGLHVSFSARGDRAAIALGRVPLGVDFEPALPPAGIPWNMLRADERAALEALPQRAQAEAFLALWRAKEATLKALGLGFRLPPEAVRIDASRATIEGHLPQFRLIQAPEQALTLAIS
jgi:phosphopantetheinyl transferase